MYSTGQDGDSTDARALFWRSKPEPPMGRLPVSIDSGEYNMNHSERGKCLIFNNKEFAPHTRLNVRNGTDSDAESLERNFRQLGFDVEIYDNYGVKKMLDTLEKAAGENHTNRDCFVCCILTHGDEGVLFGSDGRFPTENVFKPFQADSCLTLAGKPKIFFIQACQGDKLDAGVNLRVEGTDSRGICKIPTRADFLIVYSTVPGYYSWRNTTHGSWFIQALCHVLRQNAQNMDMLEMMTLVNCKVAYDFQSCVPDDPSMDQMKQVPCVTSTLTRKIYFSPKL